MMKKIALLLVAIVVSALFFALFSLRDNPARPAGGEVRQAVSNGNIVRYYVNGPAGAEPVVLLASYARSGSDFNELVESINRAGYQSIVLQARGIDGTDLPDINVSLFDYADDLAAVLDQEQHTTATTLVGHAFGNRVARAFSSRYPDRVRSLVLLAAGDSSPPPDTRNDIFMILANTLPDSIRSGALQRAFFAPGNQAPAYWMAGWYPHAGLAQGNATATTPQQQWIGGGVAPILVVQPAHDAAAAHGANKLQKLYPGRVTVLILEGAGHAILPEQPQRVSRILLDHLKNR
jgi:pimeloyl-ACP methyl ester carboxylesterase